MTRDWESAFSQWAQPPGKTEEQRCENGDSDVDVGVLCFDSFHPSYPEDHLAKSYGHSDATYRAFSGAG